jgi:hypothetical protein
MSVIARSLVRRLATSDDFAMSGDFDSLDAREKAALEAALKRCCVLADRIESILRIERRDFVDKVSLADFYASLEYAANKKGRRPVERTHLLPQRRVCRHGAISATVS